MDTTQVQPRRNPATDEDVALAREVRSRRTKDGLTQAELGQLLGVTQTTVHRIESCKYTIGRRTRAKLRTWLADDGGNVGGGALETPAEPKVDKDVERMILAKLLQLEQRHEQQMAELRSQIIEYGAQLRDLQHASGLAHDPSYRTPTGRQRDPSVGTAETGLHQAVIAGRMPRPTPIETAVELSIEPEVRAPRPGFVLARWAGAAAAGSGWEQTDRLPDDAYVPVEVLPDGSQTETWLCTARGDSMADAGIPDGSIVAYTPGAKRNDVVVARVAADEAEAEAGQGSYVVKRYLRRKNQVVLLSEPEEAEGDDAQSDDYNEEFDPIIKPASLVKLEGRVVAVREPGARWRALE